MSKIAPTVTAEDRLPGDPDKATLIDQIIRVDQAGEYGAKRIYEGQLAVLGNTDVAPALKEMLGQEEEHLKRFTGLMAERGTRPTALQPLWHVAGYAIGAATALMGKEAAMACTVAVEEVIGEHYREQAAQLGDDEKDLRETITAFREDELHHRDVSLAHGAREAPGYEALSAAVRTGTRFAIWLAKRV
ncbi:MAG: demethoxyubiquinone hydroxylase family protein [Rhodospirillaceae bacterium]|nr:demethoxyubiquinone hydroxylase family protein [Rhodospirillaceae bacterium]